MLYYKKLKQTEKVENVLADFFDTEKAALIRGGGTGAILKILSALLSVDDSMFIHKAPVYTTTKESIRILGLKTKTVDFNNLVAVQNAV